MRQWDRLETLWLDIRYSVRTMTRARGFASAAILSLALGIGANTAIFSLVHTLLLRRLAVRQPDQLVEFLVHYPGDPPGNYFSLASYEYYRDHSHVFAAITGEGLGRFHVRGEGIEPETIDTECVAGNFFPLLGVKPAIGRLIVPDNADSPVAVVSWSYWNRQFQLDPAILGKRVSMEEVPVTIVGVLPREFSGVQTGMQTDIWVPLALKWRIDPGSRLGAGALRLIARLAPGVSIEQARAEMAVLFRFTFDERTRASKDPQMQRLQFTVEPAESGLSNPLRLQFAKPLVALMTVVALLLLIACTNVASMLLARGAARQREMAVRVSLGAGRSRLVRQVLTESLLLSLAGGLLGIFVAYFGAHALARMITSGRFVGRPPHLEIPVLPEARVLLFTVVVGGLAGLLFGLAPAWNAFAFEPATSLRESRSGETPGRRLFGKSLVVVQVAFTLVLLSAAGLFVGNLSHLENLELGFHRDHILLLTLDPSGSGYEGERLARSYRDLLERLEAIPGVRSATISAPTPLSGGGAPRFANVEGHPERPEDRRYTYLKWVAPKYFETLETPLLYGRDFRFEDIGRPPVAIVNEAMARFYFGDANPIGKSVSFDADHFDPRVKSYEIIGVAGNEKYYDMREAPSRMVYLNAFQEERVPSQFALRTTIDPAALFPQVRGAVRELLKTVAVGKITTLAEQVDATIVPERLSAMLSGWFGGLGTLLAAIGLYGLLAHTVVRRTNEIGIRVALGATRGNVVGMVLRDALTMMACGLVLGAPLALWGKTLASDWIKELYGNDGVVIAFAAVALIAVGIVAACLPALRAARIEPTEALRHE